MQIAREREVIVEIEQIRVVRKRANTSIRWCEACSKMTDFLSLTRAAELFELAPATVYEFINRHSCHFAIGHEGEICICLTDMLSAMSKRISKGKVRLLGDLK